MTTPRDDSSSDDAAPAPLLPVRMGDGLLRCPHCDSYDLMPAEPGVLVCDDCSGRCSKFSDQCPECGERGVTQLETIGFSAPGQRPSEAPRKIVKRCDACGYTNA
ncbi:MAG: hypothetical protein ABI200_03395 [Gaiellales bacterium]